MLNLKGMLSGNNLTTIALTAVVVAGALYFSKKQGYISFAVRSDNTTLVASRTNHAIKWVARYVFSHSTNPSSLVGKIDQIEVKAKNHITTITQLVKDRMDRKITNRDYRQKLLLIVKQVAQEMQVVLRSHNNRSERGNRPTQAERLAKINQWFSRKQANINEHGENVAKRLAQLNKIKTKRIARTS